MPLASVDVAGAEDCMIARVVQPGIMQQTLEPTGSDRCSQGGMGKSG